MGDSVAIMNMALIKIQDGSNIFAEIHWCKRIDGVGLIAALTVCGLSAPSRALTLTSYREAIRQSEMLKCVRIEISATRSEGGGE
jgi:hypothetical protein